VNGLKCFGPGNENHRKSNVLQQKATRNPDGQFPVLTGPDILMEQPG